MGRSDYGTDPHYLVRTNDPDTSHAAAQSVDTTALEQMVHKAISNYGILGCISDQVRAMFPGYPYSSITARYRALLDKGLIKDTGLRRPGNSGRNQRVMVSTHWIKKLESNEYALHQESPTLQA